MADKIYKTTLTANKKICFEGESIVFTLTRSGYKSEFGDSDDLTIIFGGDPDQYSGILDSADIENVIFPVPPPPIVIGGGYWVPDSGRRRDIVVRLFKGETSKTFEVFFKKDLKTELIEGLYVYPALESEVWGYVQESKGITITILDSISEDIYFESQPAPVTNEGTNITLRLVSAEVGQTIFWKINGINQADLWQQQQDPAAISGSFVVEYTGRNAISHFIRNDSLTEGDEFFNYQFSKEETFNSILAETEYFMINDTSINPTPLFTLTPSTTSINEGSTLTTSVATTNVASGTTLYYSLSGTGVTTLDFSSGSLTGSGSVGSNGSFSFSHTLANDLLTEGAETLNIKLFTDSSRLTQVGSTASVSIADTSTTPPTYSIGTISSINEGSVLTTSVATTNVASGTTLYYSLSGPGITAADFSTGALTGSGTVGTDGKFSINHTLANDLTTEGAESVDIKLFSDGARKAQVGATATVSIADTSTTPPPQISVIATANGKETDSSPVVFTFTRTGSTAAALSVNYQLFGTAKAGSDYTGNTTGTINFAAGSSVATLSLPALADGALIDPYETIIARINPATNYGITTGKQFATATITAEGMVVVPIDSLNSTRNTSGNRNYIFAALKSDGSVVCWGSKDSFASAPPTGLTGVSQIFSTNMAFAALKNDGSVISWGNDGSNKAVEAPAGLTGVSQIFSNQYAFAALKSDGSVISWGIIKGTAPAGLTGVSQIFSNQHAFSALKSDGTVISWGDSKYGGNAPAGLTGVSQIFSTYGAFAALKSDGSVISWGGSEW